MERTLVLVKPDGVQRALVGRIIARFEEKGLRLIGLKLMAVSRALAETHYKDLAGKPFYPGLIKFITSAPVVAMAFEGPGVVAVVRKMLGATFGTAAEPGTIRGDFSTSRGLNLTHGSDSVESGAREVALWFKTEELVAWERTLDGWVYNTEDREPPKK
ncbi:MAG: nucleoside-diphosphate kinase [Planctomycetes bacterium]|nr:nucleoside-diphosphate kinase [Planctomycetota bacterium]